jgi:Sulfotransferase family
MGIPLFEGLQLIEKRRFAEAEALLRRALKRDRRNADLMHYLGVALCQMSRNAEGLGFIRDGLKGRPGDPKRWWMYAAYAHFAGESRRAARAIARAAELMPEDNRLLYNYCNLVRPGLDDPIVALLHGRLASGLSRKEQSYVHYGLAIVHDAAREYETAMDHALAGGAAYGVECNLDPGMVERIIRANTPAALNRAPCGGDPTEAPVFILGMPRSGTTLTEQILGAHPDLFAAGELPAGRTAELLAMSWAQQNLAINDVYEAVARIVPELEAVAAEYHLGLVRNLAPEARYLRFTDKLPENVFRLGLLGRMFPRARIILVRRHPLDTCTSCLMQRFTDVQYSYTNTIPTLAAQYLAYEKVMAHWRAVTPLRLLEVRYESLVAEPEPQIRRILGFLGLPWDPACLSPETQGRMVKTASARQVREGINARSIGRWKRYESRLGPLVAALGGLGQVEEWAAREAA